MTRSSAKGAAKVVDTGLAARSIAKTVANGDIVDFRLLFSPFSPARTDSTEHFDDDKYSYLLPGDDENDAPFSAAITAVQAPPTWAHIERELAANRPPQLPSELVLMLGDNAVRLGKWTSAAQAYELLRIRRRMQEEFFTQGRAALDAGDVPRAVRAFRAGVGLAYDYAAFPEPLPLVPRYQTRALMMHGSYPLRPEDCIALAEPETHVQAALDYLLYDGDAAARLRDVPFERRLEFLRELVAQADPDWATFVERYSEACRRTTALGTRLQRSSVHQPESLAEEIEELQSADPWDITRALLGRDMPEGEWWQYLKELAYEHPAAILFIARQVIGEDEILMPRLRADSPVAKALGLGEHVATTSSS